MSKVKKALAAVAVVAAGTGAQAQEDCNKFWDFTVQDREASIGHMDSAGNSGTHLDLTNVKINDEVLADRVAPLMDKVEEMHDKYKAWGVNPSLFVDSYDEGRVIISEGMYAPRPVHELVAQYSEQAVTSYGEGNLDSFLAQSDIANGFKELGVMANELMADLQTGVITELAAPAYSHTSERACPVGKVELKTP